MKRTKANIDMKETCYLCGAESSSKEHTPAKCFFPNEPKYRRNLIKVPSCKKHNEDTSKDDEYVRNLICMHIDNNSVAYKQFIAKVIHTFEHSPKLKSQTFSETKQVFVKDGENIKQTFALNIDRDRFDKVMKKISYALYFHEYGKVWQHGLIIATENLFNDDMQPDLQGQLIQTYKSKLNYPAFNGENPKVFQYKFEETEINEVILWMKFYEGFEVFVFPNINTSKPDF